MTPEILSIIRAAHAVEVVYMDDKGKIVQKDFPKSMNTADIKAVISGSELPIKKEDAKEPEKPIKVQTVPEPPVATKNRITRAQMIEALERAGVVDYNPNNRESLTSAFESLRKGK